MSLLRSRLLMGSLVAALVAAFTMIVLPSSPAAAHGSVANPVSRNYGCWQRWGSDFQNPRMATEDPMCWQAWQANPNAMWNWNGLYREGLAGNHQGGIPDGTLCSGGRAEGGRYTSMDTVGDWTPTPPPTTPPPTTPPPTTPPPASGDCTATYKLDSSWGGGYQATVTVTAGSAAVRGWNVRMAYGAAPTIQQAWNATVSASGTTATATNAGYNGALAPGASTTFGFIASGTSSTPVLTCAGAA